ncbi:MAG: tRNA uridine-5-carboxymethylaminomethyl(34) synthesis GTPase MnmE, partial [Leptonema sp. (in: Bacteria)]|nr:tRNA uridine-5-carboxymethylaminomethyl(34) synthesis GTPase MnmE [Leptonema sp. (in: bacteria)]
MKRLTTISETEFNDTIAALATANGHSAIAVVRVSGPQTLHLLSQICRTTKNSAKQLFADKPRQYHRVDIVDTNDSLIDDGLAVFFPGPNSYTGEDSAEISLHGSPLIVRRLLIVMAEKFSIRPALAGEFTRRAFQNGRIDLTKAESIQRIIDAKSEYELMGAQRLYSGELKKLVSRFRSALINLKAETEAEVDFSDEDLTFESLHKRRNRVNELLSQIELILKRSGAAQRVNQGFKVALVGVTNAGKSSLLNRLLGYDRSIVSDIHGTTRDYVSEDVELGEFRIRFVDTAGLRSTQDVIEREGIRRSVEEMRRSQLILHIIDGSSPSLTIT